MAKGFKHGGGGAALNFTVVGGTEQPARAKENTIWVNTDQKITDWVFSATEPTEPLNGMVWISTGTSSAVEFNALKKNGIQVYPISAKQYVDGAWADKAAKIYQNGVWLDWLTYIVKSGQASGTFSYMSSAQGNISGLQNEAGFDVTVKKTLGGFQGTVAYVMCIDALVGIDLSKFKEISVSSQLAVQGAQTEWKVYVWEGNTVPTSVPTTLVASAALPGNSPVVLPLDGLTPGSYVVGIYGKSYDSSTLRILDFYLK